VLPVVYGREDDVLYLHGSPLSRLLSGLARGVPACLTVTLLDGLVLARSAFHHSINYRSAMVLGEAQAITDPVAKAAALQVVVEHTARGRASEVRAPNAAELDATEVIALLWSEASAKVRTGPPVDAAEDYSLNVWAGEIPLGLEIGEPVADHRCHAPLPPYLATYNRGGDSHAQPFAA
jgi:nitroimidazol reductase NimA-like FMN-containing flavoprotein (pyridoxamine 5'-phosphate oxidase superfamily)